MGLLFPAPGRSGETLTPPTVIGAIDIGPGPGFDALPGIGTTSATVDIGRNLIYVANAGNSTVSVVDGKTDTILTTIAIDDSQNIPSGFVSGAARVLMDEEKNLLYVLTNNGTLSVVDAKTYQVKFSFVFDSDAGGFEGLVTPTMVLSKITGKLYVQNDNFRIDIIDLKKQKVIGYIDDDQLGPLAINQRANKIYTSNAWDGTVWVIDGYTDQVVDKISGVGRPAVPAGCYVDGTCTDYGSTLAGVAVDEELERLYVASEDGRVVIVDTKTDQVINVVSNIPAYNLTVNPADHAVYVIDDGGATLSAIDGVSGNPTASNISVGGSFSSSSISSPQNITVNPRNGKIYVSDFGFTGPNQVVVLKSCPKTQ